MLAIEGVLDGLSHRAGLDQLSGNHSEPTKGLNEDGSHSAPKKGAYEEDRP